MQATAIVPAVQQLRGQAPKDDSKPKKKAAGKRKKDESAGDESGAVTHADIIHSHRFIFRAWQLMIQVTRAPLPCGMQACSAQCCRILVIQTCGCNLWMVMRYGSFARLHGFGTHHLCRFTTAVWWCIEVHVAAVQASEEQIMDELCTLI